MIEVKSVFEIFHAGEIHSRLVKDAAKCQAWIETDDDQFFRRQYIRSVFALIEGVTYRMKQIVYAMHEQGEIELEPGEANLLAEVDYRLRKNGSVVSREAKLRTLPNIRFAFAKFIEHSAEDYEVDWGGKEWENVREALEIRHRLTHPKGLDDLNVTDEELAVVKESFDWYSQAVIKAFQYASEYHRKRYEELTGKSADASKPPTSENE